MNSGKLLGTLQGQGPGKPNPKTAEMCQNIFHRDATPHFPALRSGHWIFQRPSPGKQFPSNGVCCMDESQRLAVSLYQMCVVATC